MLALCLRKELATGRDKWEIGACEIECGAGRDPARDFAGCGINPEGSHPAKIFEKNPACGIPQMRFCRTLVCIIYRRTFHGKTRDIKKRCVIREVDTIFTTKCHLLYKIP